MLKNTELSAINCSAAVILLKEAIISLAGPLILPISPAAN